ncbi:nitrite reductase small subunit NirD [Marinomonas spartinae]|uniref:nitrite reductase small subunit NirD n=1 Tax=Marinomonas spartinae TaxID=1792290 RepID=UPI0018F23C6A|nr:nitrite reductase small subunit NirD [Marinomonas spartinae]MBJ7553459.1 nitrite reductase small subunit NirD [Marinomonas spartinae]
MNNWLTICNITDIAPNTGVCAKVGEKQVAIFFHKRTDALYAISNYDPIGKANVLSRGIIGSIGDQLCVASPLYKQHFDLQTGTCLEDPSVHIDVYKVRQNSGLVQIHQ